jgi:DNA-binding NarL/FixJ family response regulator
MPLRILIADDNEGVRHGTSLLLLSEQDWEICGEASDGDEVIERVRTLKPDLLLVDMRMPKRNGLDIVRTVHKEFAHVKMIVMSEYDATMLGPVVSAAGASGCIDKGRLSLDLVNLVKTVTS